MMGQLNLRELENNTRTRDYFLGELADGTTLAKLTRDALDLDTGRFFLAIPTDRGLGEISSLRESIGHMPSPGGWDAFSALVVRFLRDYSRAVLFQDTMASISDPWLQGDPLRHRVMSHAEELYYYIEGVSLNENQIFDLSPCGSPYPFAGFFFPMAWQGMKPELTDDDFAHIVRTLIGVNVGALDEDTFLLWWRDGAERPWREGEPLVP
jgi:hypothetical protein